MACMTHPTSRWQACLRPFRSPSPLFWIAVAKKCTMFATYLCISPWNDHLLLNREQNPGGRARVQIIILDSRCPFKQFYRSLIDHRQSGIARKTFSHSTSGRTRLSLMHTSCLRKSATQGILVPFRTTVRLDSGGGSFYICAGR